MNPLDRKMDHWAENITIVKTGRKISVFIFSTKLGNVKKTFLDSISDLKLKVPEKISPKPKNRKALKPP